MPEPHELLDEAMKRRRLELRMNWRQVVETAGISYEALRAIRRGDYRPTELTARRLDDALQWLPGSVTTVLAGGEPTAIEDAPVTDELSASAPASLSQELDLAARLLGSTVKEMGLSPTEADEVWAQVRARIVADHEQGAEHNGPSIKPRENRTGS